MAGSAILSIKILADASSAKRGLDTAATSMDKFKSGVRKAAVPAALVGAALIKFGKDAAESASRTQQAFGGVDAVFGKNADTVKKWADSAAGSIGLAKSEYGELATLIGSQLSNAGLPLDVVTKKTKSLIDQGADLAAMFGGTTADAVAALSSAMKGEFDPLEKYGTSLSAAKIAAQMAADGTDKLTGKAAQQAKTLATLKLITQQTAKAHGAAAREQDTLAARTQQAAAEFENLKSDLGTALLPILAAVANVLAKVARWMAENQTIVKIVVGVIAALVVVILALNVALSITATVSAVLALTWLPIALIVIGIAAAVAALIVIVVVLYKKFPQVRKVVDATFAGMKAIVRVFARLFVQQITTAITAVKAIVKALVTAWKTSITAIRTAWSAMTTAIRSAFATMKTKIVTVAGNLKTAVTGVWDKIAAAVDAVVTAIGTAFGEAIGKAKAAMKGLEKILKGPWEAMKTAVDAVKTAIGYVVTAIGNVISALGRIKVPAALSKIGGIIGKVVPNTVAPAAAAPAVRGPRTPAAAATSAAGGRPLVININGAIDPEGTARTVRRVLEGHDRRVGLRVT
jgi:phage-related protein